MLGTVIHMVMRTCLFLLSLLSIHQYTFGKPLHGFSVYEPLKYEKDFKHFDYVNTAAIKDGVLNLAELGIVESYNPYSYKMSPTAGLDLVFSTLMTRSQDEPASCYAYTAQSVEFLKDENAVVFTLNPHAQFHDGSPLRADDVKATFQALTQTNMPHYKILLEPIERLEKIGPHKIKLFIKKASIKEMAYIFATQIYILKKEDLQKYPLATSLRVMYTGSGPYKIEKTASGSKIIYNRVRPWWGDKLPSSVGHFNFSKIIYTFYQSDNASFEALKAGLLDVRLEKKAQQWNRGYTFPAVKQKKIRQVEKNRIGNQGVLGLAFNLRDPKFQDVHVREALSLMLNFDWLNRNILHNAYKRCTSLFQNAPFQNDTPLSQEESSLLEALDIDLPPLFHKPFFKRKSISLTNMRHRFKEALQLMEQGGWVLKNGGLVNKKTGEPFELSILLPYKSFERLVGNFAVNLQKLGIKISIESPDMAVYRTRVDNRDFDILAQYYIPSKDVPTRNLRSLWHSSLATINGTQNVPGVQSSDIDKIIDYIEKANSKEKLYTALSLLSRLVMHNHYIIPQWYINYDRLAVSQKIGFPQQPFYHGIGIDTFWVEPNPLTS